MNISFICLTLIALKLNVIRDFLFILFIETCFVFKLKHSVWGLMPLTEYKTSILITLKTENPIWMCCDNCYRHFSTFSLILPFFLEK